MAKKQRRQVSSGQRVERPASPTYTPSASLRRVAPAAEFKPDYSRVFTDLKRIGVLAGSFFAILIVLSFFLR
jgi:hypothetical protein